MENNREISLWLVSLLMGISIISSSQDNYCFIENKRQFPESVYSKVKVPSGAVFIEKGKFTYAFYNNKQLQERHNLSRKEDWIDAHSLSVSFMNYNKNSTIELLNKSNYYENYYNTENWAEKVYSFKTLTHKNIYQGIDLNMYSSKGLLKYDLIVYPGTLTKKIKLKYKGHNEIYLKNENLIVSTSVNEILELKPFSYQIINGDTLEVKSNFKLKNNTLTFDFPNGYDKNHKLIIDPTLIFSTYSGSVADNFGYTATYDNAGFLYSGSTVFGIGYPTTSGAYQINYSNNMGGTDIGITKYDTSGMSRIYSTYLGGSMDELPHSMIVNNLNELFVFGTTGSDNFPTTPGCYKNTFSGGNGFSPSGLGVSFPNGSDIIVSRISSNGGALLSSTYLGGSDNDGLNTSQKLKRNYADEVRGEIDIDKNNNVYLATCTYSTDFPITNSFQKTHNGQQEGCVLKLDNQLSTLIWSSFLGGSRDDAVYSLAIDKNDNVFLTGGTNSYNFPSSSNAFQSNYQDSIRADAFITHVSSDGNLIINSTYFGTEFYDQSYFVELNSDEEVYIFGQTKSLGDDLVHNANYYTSNSNQFIAVFTNNLEKLLRSTVVGTGKGTPDISPTAFLVDVCNNIYISGWGSSTGNGPLSTLNMPITPNAFQNTTDGNDFYIMILNDNLDNLVYATYFGGSQSAEHVDGGTSRFSKEGVIYQSVCAGCGGNNDFPIEPDPGAVSSTNNSNNCNNGVFKFDFNFPIVLADFDATWASCNNNVSFVNTSKKPSNTSYYWDFGDGNNSTQESPSHQYLSSGIYEVTLISSSPDACNISDTIRKNIYILSNSSYSIDDIEICKNQSVQIGVLPINNNNISYYWEPSYGLNNITIPNPIANVGSSQQYKLIISDGNCSDTIFQWIIVDSISVNVSNDTTFCKDPILISANTSGFVNSIQWSNNIDFSNIISNTDTFTVNNPGVYYVYVNNENCFDMDSVNIINENISIEISGISEICVGDSIFIKVDDLNSLEPIASYEWNSNFPMIFSSDSSSFVSYPTYTSYYSVKSTNILGCYVLDSVLVYVNQYPTIDSIWVTDSVIYEGESVLINVETDDNILWETNENANTINVSPENSELFHVTIYNDYCEIKDSIFITVLDVFCDKKKISVPNAFSPNGDLINDNYKVIDEDGIIIDFKIEIFNRFGQSVYTSEDINSSWNGYFNGELLPPQVFDYYLQIKCIGDKSLFEKGNITLVR